MRRTAPRPPAGVPAASGPEAGPEAAAEAAGAAVAAPAAPAAPVETPQPTLSTEFAFELPRGYVDESGTVHRHGVMRLATAKDELVPLRDLRVQENPAYLSVVLLGRVITRLGTLPLVHDGVWRTCSPPTSPSCRTSTGRSTPRATRGRGVLPALRAVVRGRTRREPPGGIVTYATDRMHEEIAYIAYHFHWSQAEILDLEHRDRRRYVEQIATLVTRAEAER